MSPKKKNSPTTDELGSLREVRKLAAALADATAQRWDDHDRPLPLTVTAIDAAREFIDSYDEQYPYPIADRPVEHFRSHVRKLEQIAAQQVDEEESGPLLAPVGFYESLNNAVEAVLKDPPARLREMLSPADMRARGDADRTIAHAWGRTRVFIFPVTGEVDDELIAREINEPGSVITPEVRAADRRRMLVELGFRRDESATV